MVIQFYMYIYKAISVFPIVNYIRISNCESFFCILLLMAHHAYSLLQYLQKALYRFPRIRKVRQATYPSTVYHLLQWKVMQWYVLVAVCNKFQIKPLSQIYLSAPPSMQIKSLEISAPFWIHSNFTFSIFISKLIVVEMNCKRTKHFKLRKLL